MTNKGRIVTATHAPATAPNGIPGGRMVTTAAAFAGTTKNGPGDVREHTVNPGPDPYEGGAVNQSTESMPVVTHADRVKMIRNITKPDTDKSIDYQIESVRYILDATTWEQVFDGTRTARANELARLGTPGDA